MSQRTKLISLWVFALLSPLVAGYALLSSVTYVWLNAAGSLPRERAEPWAWGAFFLFCLFAVVTVVSVVRLVRYYNSLPHLPDREEVTS